MPLAAARRRPDALFPGSSGIRDETLILTRQRAAIAHLLGRQPTGQENAIQIHRILMRLDQREAWRELSSPAA